MKKTLTFFCLFIFLYGNFGKMEQEVAKKYSNFIRNDVAIHMVDNPGNDFGHKNCGLSDEQKPKGCAYLFSNGERWIEIKRGLPRSEFTYFMVHEIMHTIYGSDENRISGIAGGLVHYVENLR